MAHFITRVELHDASVSDYEKLHAEMEARGFSRNVKGEDGIIYQLPTAEYVYICSEKVEKVRNKAARAAASTGKTYSVVANQILTQSFHLPKANA